MSAKLKPCPLCGENVVMTEIPLRDARTGKTSYRYEVECPCGLSFVVKHATEEEAIYRWNRRANDMPEAVELLGKCVSELQKRCDYCAGKDGRACIGCSNSETRAEIDALLAKLEGGADNA